MWWRRTADGPGGTAPGPSAVASGQRSIGTPTSDPHSVQEPS
jgi:hypothetical protein